MDLDLSSKLFTNRTRQEVEVSYADWLSDK